jgi:hypothetical protein
MRRKARLKDLSANSQLAFDYFDAPAQLFHLSLKGAGLLELASRPGRAEGSADHEVERHDALRAVEAGDHLGRDEPAPVPRPQYRSAERGSFVGLTRSKETCSEYPVT